MIDVDNEAYILWKIKKKTAKEQAMRTRVEDIFFERLNYFCSGLNKNQGTKKYQKVIEMVGRLKGKYPTASKLYNVKIIPEKGKDSSDPTLKVVSIKGKKKDDNSISALTFTRRTIEWTPPMFISVLAYHILHIIEYRLHQNNDHRNWSTMRNVLNTHTRISISFQVKIENGELKIE